MTSRAIGQAGNFSRTHALMTFDAPAHALAFLDLGGLHLDQVAMTSFTGDSRRDVWAVIKMNKVRFDGNWNPGDFLVRACKLSQFIQLRTLFLNLLVAAPAFACAGQARRRSPGGGWMAINTLGSQPDVKGMRVLNRLGRRLLS